jgi:hypothetical protein
MMWLVLGAGLALGVGLALVIHARSRRSEAPAAPASNAPAMLACPVCGNSIAADWDFCPFCAQALTQDETGHRQASLALPAAGAGST